MYVHYSLMRFPIFAALLLLAAPACAQTVKPPAPIPTEALNAHPALWAVKDADTTIYLFGTVHALKPDIRWFGGPVKTAFESASELKLEIVDPDPAEMAQLVMTMATAAATAPALTERLTPAQKAKYIAQMDANGLPWAQLERLEPWFVTITLAVAPLQKLGFSSDDGVEKALTEAARASGKAISGLETPAQQLGFFDGLSDTSQIAFLTATVDELPKFEIEFGKLIAAWSAGRDKELAKELNESLTTSPELADVLLVQRNARWAKWIAERMKQPGVVFIAVGAGHLAGKNSVQADLARLGFKARRVAAGK
jgi:hypothetical protein